MRKITDISKVYELKFLPTSIRIPRLVMDYAREEAKKNGKTVSKHITTILAERYINDSEK